MLQNFDPFGHPIVKKFARDGRVVIRTSIWRNLIEGLVSLIACAIFTFAFWGELGDIFANGWPESSSKWGQAIVMIALILFFLIWVVVSFVAIFRKPVVLTMEGIKVGSRDTVPWSAVAQYKLIRKGGYKYVDITLHRDVGYGISLSIRSDWRGARFWQQTPLLQACQQIALASDAVNPNDIDRVS